MVTSQQLVQFIKFEAQNEHNNKKPANLFSGSPISQTTWMSRCQCQIKQKYNSLTLGTSLAIVSFSTFYQIPPPLTIECMSCAQIDTFVNPTQRPSKFS